VVLLGDGQEARNRLAAPGDLDGLAALRELAE
jgi:hypothetical protein